jgi:hypothetical protein
MKNNNHLKTGTWMVISLANSINEGARVPLAQKIRCKATTLPARVVGLTGPTTRAGTTALRGLVERPARKHLVARLIQKYPQTSI